MEPTHAHHEIDPRSTARQEHSDVQIRGLILFLAALVIGLLFVSLAVLYQYRLALSRAERQDAPRTALAERRLPPPPPHLQVSPPADLAALELAPALGYRLCRRDREPDRQRPRETHEKGLRLDRCE